MKYIVTSGIVLTRTNYGEADRIITVLTPDNGKIRVIAKGARKIKSKLAGGIELFSVSDITYLPGRRDISTLVSSRLREHFGAITTDIDDTMMAYSLLKRLNKATEDEAGEEYFTLLRQGLAALQQKVPRELVEAWFLAHLLQFGGHQPNLRTDVLNQPLVTANRYVFDTDSMCFRAEPRGPYTANSIKLLRLLFQVDTPVKLLSVKDHEVLVPKLQSLILSLYQLQG